MPSESNHQSPEQYEEIAKPGRFALYTNAYAPRRIPEQPLSVVSVRIILRNLLTIGQNKTKTVDAPLYGRSLLFVTSGQLDKTWWKPI